MFFIAAVLYIGTFLGEKRVVNEFCGFFSVASLKTEVCHIEITSHKVIVLFFSIERGAGELIIWLYRFLISGHDDISVAVIYFHLV